MPLNCQSSANTALAALEHATQALDVSGRPVGKVAQRAFAHLAALAIALAQQDGGRRVPVRDGFDIHAANVSRSGRAVQLTTALLHGYGFRPGEAVFPGFPPVYSNGKSEARINQSVKSSIHRHESAVLRHGIQDN